MQHDYIVFSLSAITGMLEFIAYSEDLEYPRLTAHVDLSIGRHRFEMLHRIDDNTIPILVKLTDGKEMTVALKRVSYTEGYDYYLAQFNASDANSDVIISTIIDETSVQGW